MRCHRVWYSKNKSLSCNFSMANWTSISFPSTANRSKKRCSELVKLVRRWWTCRRNPSRLEAETSLAHAPICLKGFVQAQSFHSRIRLEHGGGGRLEILQGMAPHIPSLIIIGPHALDPDIPNAKVSAESAGMNNFHCPFKLFPSQAKKKPSSRHEVLQPLQTQPASNENPLSQ